MNEMNFSINEYNKKKLEAFQSGQFSLKSKRKEWKSVMFLKSSGQSANLFLVQDETKQAIAKLYKQGLDKKSFDIISRLENNVFTENFLDLCQVQIDGYYFTFVVFSQIKYTHHYIPYFLTCEKAREQLLEALDYIHSLNILHNDLTCSNIMMNIVGDQARLVLVDFQFAVDFDSKCFFDGMGVVPEFKHPLMWVDPKYFDKNIDKWSGMCALYKIFFDSILFKSKVLNRYFYTCRADKIFVFYINVVLARKYYLIENVDLNRIEFFDILSQYFV